MLSKSTARATALAALLIAGCATPWRNEAPGDEVNLAFTLEDNLVRLSSVRVAGREGRFILGTAAPHTVISDAFERPARRQAISLGAHEVVHVSPQTMSLAGVADAILGADLWRRGAVTIDYRSGLVTWQKDGIHSGSMQIYQFPAEPMIEVWIDGSPTAVIVDTTSPDTLVLPSSKRGRTTAHLRIGDVDFGRVDVALADVSRPRIGNRLLSKFLVTVDYSRKVVGLWRDPRIPLAVAP